MLEAWQRQEALEDYHVSGSVDGYDHWHLWQSALQNKSYKLPQLSPYVIDAAAGLHRYIASIDLSFSRSSVGQLQKQAVQLGVR